MKPLSLIGLLFLAVLIFVPDTLLAADLTIGNYQLIRSERVGRTHYLYTYKADVINAGADQKNVTATVKSNAPYTEVIDGVLTFGDVGALATITSSDTFQIKQDRLYKFDFSNLEWTISGSQLEADEVLSTVVRDLQVGNLRAAATKFASNHKVERLLDLTPAGADLLAQMLADLQVVYDSPTFRTYEKEWQTPEGDYKTIKIIMTRNANGHWKIACW